LIVGNEMPDAAARSACDNPASARAALIWRIDTKGIDKTLPRVVILSVLNRKQWSNAMPENLQTLPTHLSKLQDAAYLAKSLVGVILACGTNKDRWEVALSAADAANDILAEIGEGLDYVNLPEVSA
jgi:hypothetical protein